ncbi:hypothetical protein GCM10027275_15650 [Rhabdobacter roseus]
MMFNGFPLVFFIRDTLHIGPATNVFTAFFFALALLLMFPTHLFIRLYKPNFTLLKYAMGFLVIAFYHFIFMNYSEFDWFIELGNFLFTIAFIFLLIHVPNDVKEVLMVIIFLAALFSNLTLVYSLLTDPSWRIGMRAAVTFENAGAQEGGNPHIAARNGVICLLAALTLISQYKGALIRLFLFFSIIFSLAVVVLAQAKSSLLALGIMAAFYMTFQANFSQMLRSAKSLFSVRNAVIFLICWFLFGLLLSRYGDLVGVLYGYWGNFQDKIMDIIFTAFGLQISGTANIDASAMGRVSSLSFFQNALEGAPHVLLIGLGYKAAFLDVPLVESIVNHGIFGFIFFAGFNYYLLVYSIKELRKNSNPLSLFLAYFFIYFIIMLISNGRPYDVSFWFPYALMIRFLGIKYLDSPQYKENKNSALTTV